MGMTNTGTTLLPLLMPESTSVIGPDCGLDLCSPCIDWHFQCRYAKSSGTCFHGEIYSRANDLKYPVSAQQIAGPFQTGPSKQIVFLCLPKFVSKKASKNTQKTPQIVCCARSRCIVLRFCGQGLALFSTVFREMLEDDFVGVAWPIAIIGERTAWN